ncbi:STAS domain-containing protein [Streptomyces sp. NPDC059442]|uniref:STAS domain-containing protein n=1 Tax=unclassified Streptomyces TaxID=2593676 RepID=UPI0036B93897
MRTFEVNVDELPDRTLIVIAGELDMTTCPTVTEAVHALPLGGRTLSLDLSRLAFLDSSGLNLLLELRLRVQQEDGTLELRGVQERVLRVLRITGAEGLFHLSPRPPTAAVPGHAA